MTIKTLNCNATTNIFSQVKHLVLAFVVVGRRLNEEVLVSFIFLIESVVTKSWEIMIEHSVSVVLSYAAELNDTIHLLRVRQKVSLTHELLEVLAIELERLFRISHESWVLCVFLPIVVSGDYERWDQRHDWLVEWIHNDQLTYGTNELLHLYV